MAAFKSRNLFIIFIILAVIILSISYSTAEPYRPFSFSDLKKYEFPYSEGFESPLKYTDATTYQATDTLVNNLLQPSNQTCKKVIGMNGLFCQPFVADNIIDPLFGTESSTTCAGSGLTKSNGNVCLNDKQYKLLTTRGGNSTGRDSQIGN
jgi:hypothetical protein